MAQCQRSQCPIFRTIPIVGLCLSTSSIVEIDRTRFFMPQFACSRWFQNGCCALVVWRENGDCSERLDRFSYRFRLLRKFIDFCFFRLARLDSMSEKFCEVAIFRSNPTHQMFGLQVFCGTIQGPTYPIQSECLEIPAESLVLARSPIWLESQWKIRPQQQSVRYDSHQHQCQFSHRPTNIAKNWGRTSDGTITFEHRHAHQHRKGRSGRIDRQ